MYSHILFDADNTLLDFSKAERIAFIQTMQAHSIPWDEAMLSRYVGINAGLWQEFEKGLVDKETVQVRRFEMLFGCASVSCADINASFQKHLSEQAHLMPFAKEVCEGLSRVAKLSIATNGVGATQRRKLMNCAVWPYMTRLFISEELGFPKPDPRFFDHVLRELGGPERSRVLIVGDSLTSDIQGGMNAGLATCWLNPGGQAVPDGYRADYVIRDLRGLFDIVSVT
jgi:2-haloacid dehalogenase